MKTIYESMDGDPLKRLKLAASDIQDEIGLILQFHRPIHVDRLPDCPIPLDCRIEVVGVNNQGIVFSNGWGRLTTGQSSGDVGPSILEMTTPRELLEITRSAESEVARLRGVRAAYEYAVEAAIKEAVARWHEDLHALGMVEKPR